MCTEYIIRETATILEALSIIDANRKGFIIIVDEKNYVLGTVTDGDIRRSLIHGHELFESIINIANRNYLYLKSTDNFETVVEYFKNPKVQFLPILDNEMKLKNIITKKQLHLLLLEGSIWEPETQFDLMDEAKLEHEIYNRPWGYYKTVFLSDFARAKIICVYPNGKLSLQEHKFREEHWVIVKGNGELTIGESVKNVENGDYIFIPKSCKHTIENKSPDKSLFISEVQLGTYFGEDDIIRYSDIYGRV